MNSDFTKSFTDSEYHHFVERLSAQTVEALRSARERRVSFDQAIRDYLVTAYQAGLSISECVDFFCVSTPSISESTGFPPDEVDEIIKLFDSTNAELAPKYFKLA